MKYYATINIVVIKAMLIYGNTSILSRILQYKFSHVKIFMEKQEGNSTKY
jgi:hypothetical protein